MRATIDELVAACSTAEQAEDRMLSDGVSSMTDEWLETTLAADDARCQLNTAILAGLSLLELLTVIASVQRHAQPGFGLRNASGSVEILAMGELVQRVEHMSAHDRARLGAIR